MAHFLTMASRQFDVRLIPEFSGAATDTPILEWLEDLELTCEVCEISKIERVLSLRLKGAARETYRQLSKEQRDDVEEFKRAIIKAYGTDSFLAFEQFTTRRRRPEETADEFLTDLQRLAWLVGETPPECWIKTAFVNGLPSDVKGLLWSSTRLETLTLREVLERARAVLVDTRDKHLAAVARHEQTSHTPNTLKSHQSDVTCFRCGGPNHLARDCMQRSSVRHWKERSSIRCHLCNKTVRETETGARGSCHSLLIQIKGGAPLDWGFGLWQEAHGLWMFSVPRDWISVQTLGWAGIRCSDSWRQDSS